MYGKPLYLVSSIDGANQGEIAQHRFMRPELKVCAAVKELLTLIL